MYGYSSKMELTVPVRELNIYFVKKYMTMGGEGGHVKQSVTTTDLSI